MPILSIKALPQSQSNESIKAAMKKTCAVISEVYGCKPEQVWATWEEIKPGFYVEGSTEADSQPDQTHPPIAELLCFEGKSEKQIEELLLLASKTLSEALHIGDNIFMTYREAKSGTVVAGNGVVRK